MTSPYDDELTSRFEIDVNFRQDSVRSLDEVTDLLSRARVESEALSRASGDVVEHLREAASTEPITIGDQAQGGIAFSPGAFDGGRLPPLQGAPSDGREPSDRGVGTAGGGTSTNVSDRLDLVNSAPREAEVTDRLEELNRKDPDRIENLRAARGLDKEGRESGNTFSAGIEGFSGLAQSILSETRPGNSISSTMSRAAEGLGALGGNNGLAGLIGGRGLGVLGLAGGALTAGVAANAAIQAAGQQEQQYRNMGSITGQGAMAGISHEMAIRTMAMNPFLTTEQSRKIIMTALSEGYTGQEFDTVTEYMADNLKNMNMDVAQSTAILRKNVEEGGQSIQQLNADLAALKTSTQGGVMSLEERTQLYQQTSGQMIDMGIDASNASQTALEALELFEDDRQLSGVFSNIISDPSDALVMQAGRNAGIMGRNPYQMKQMLGDSGQLLSASYDLIRRWALDINARNNDELTKKQMFNQQLAALGIQMTPNDSDALFEELIKEGSENFVTEAEERFQEENHGVRENDMNPLTQGLSEARAVVGMGGQFLFDTLSMIDLGFGEDETFLTNFTEAYRSTGDSYQNLTNKMAEGAGGRIAMLDVLNEEFGANNVQIVNEKGRAISQSMKLSQEDMEKVASGEWKVRVRGRDPVAIQDARALMEQNYFDDEPEDSRLAGRQVEVEVSATPELQRMLRFDVRSANQQRADAGYGTATHNNPPVGDR